MIQIKRILFPTDFSDCSRSATEYAFDVAERFEAELHLLHIVEDVRSVVPEYYYGAVDWPDDYREQIEAGARRQLEELVASYGTTGRRTVPVLRQGRPFAEIIAYAEEEKADLVVIGTHGRSALAHVLMGSVAERVVRHAPCPVLTVRPNPSCRSKSL